VASNRRPGSQDATLELMKTYSIPLTRENYLEVAYFGNPPEMTAELEAMLPDEIKTPQKGALSK
jgi:hypothetical protein